MASGKEANHTASSQSSEPTITYAVSVAVLLGALLVLSSRTLPAVPMPGSLAGAAGLALSSATFPLAWSIYRRRPFPLKRLPWVVGWCIAARFFFDGLMRWKATVAHTGFPWDTKLSALDAALHGGPAWKLLPASAWFLKLGDLAYYVWFLVLVGGILVWAWHPSAARRQRVALAFVLLWIVGGILVARALASAGPIFIGQGPQLPEHLTTVAVRDALWGAYLGGSPTSISAMPSLHVALPALYAMSARSGWIKWSLIGYTCLMLAASVALGWHYAIDGYAGILIAAGCWWVSGFLAVPRRGRMSATTPVIVHDLDQSEV